MLHNSNKETILKEEIQENTLAIYLEDEQINYIPEKDSGYTLDTEKSSCTSGVTIGFDYNTWSVKTNFQNYINTDASRVKCNLYFKKVPLATEYILSLADSSDELVYDETTDNNLRYIGADPNNYVSFNNELWRIIGVMNNIDDGTGKVETRLKIIRDEPIGNFSWDYDSVGSFSNDWSTSALMNLLNNGAYYNRTMGSYYNNSTTATNVDFTSIGLTNEAKSMISDAVWNLGGLSISELESNYYYNVNTSLWYEYERGTIVKTEELTTWTGQIGLMYPSSYGYATNGGNIGRNECLEKPLAIWDNYDDCYKNSWLFDSSGTQWTINSVSSNNISAYYVFSGGFVGFFTTNREDALVAPTVYLSSNVKIIDGIGTKEDLFLLAL